MGAEDLGLVPNKEGYQVIELEGCDFLLATTADGSFDLSDAYVQVSAAAQTPQQRACASVQLRSTAPTAVYNSISYAYSLMLTTQSYKLHYLLHLFGLKCQNTGMCAYFQDDESGIYAEPDVTSGELPTTAQQYAQIEWQEEYLGDVVYDKPPKFLVSQHLPHL